MRQSFLIHQKPAPIPILRHGFNALPPGLVSKPWQAEEGIWNISYTISGAVQEILAQGKTWQKPHDFMVIKPGGSHAWEVPRDAKESWQVIWFIFMPKPEWIPLLDLPEEFPRFSRIPLAGRRYDGRIRRSLLQAHRFAGIPEGGHLLALNALERALLWLQAEMQTSNAQIDQRVQATMELLFKRMENPPSIPEAAAKCGLSPSRLAGLFREGIGQTPHVWFEHARLKHARDMLVSTGLPVKLIAAACGYADQRHFATRFRKLFGRPPTQCRLSGVKKKRAQESREMRDRIDLYHVF